MCDMAESKLAVNGKELSRPSTTDQSNGKTTQAKSPEFHEGDLYLCSESLNALEGALGGVCEGIDAVFNERGPNRAFVCIRPPGHHCSADMPSGFCWLNNVHVGIGHAVLTHGLTHAAIIDFDLHHGDGSQSITWAHNSRIGSMPKNTPISRKTAIGYFSLHDINSYPCETGDEEKVRNASLCIENAHGQTIWNVHLQPWKTEKEFWQLYEERYSIVLTKARNFLQQHSERLRQAPTHPKPKAAIFLSAGFDASEWESPGMQRHQVNVPTEFYARLTRDVVIMAEEECLGVGGRVISILEGGYSDRALMSGVLSHVSGLASATSSSRLPNLSNGLGLEMGRRLGTLNINGDHIQARVDLQEENFEAFESSWWSLPHLEEIEALTNPPAPAATHKKQRNDGRPTYTSATQSYTAKIISAPQGRRSISGSNGSYHQGGSSIARAPSPPPPAVNWATAAHELSKLLVPSDRETRSCKPEDLNAEASRARRDRYSMVGLPVDMPVIDPKKMQLRDRRAKPSQHASDDEEGKPVSRGSRRRTFADVSLLAEDIESTTTPPSHTSVGQPLRQARRRSSVASTASSMTMERGSDFSLGSANDAQVRQDPLVIKKSRAPANPRSEVAKTKAIRKQAPAPRVSSVSSTTSRPENQAISGQEAGKAPLAEQKDMLNKDVDQLTSGMKKISIKLNVPPKQEYEARETKPKAASRGRAIKSTVAKPMKPVSPAKAKIKPVTEASLPQSAPNEPLKLQQLPPPTLSELAQETLAPALALPEQLLQPAAQGPVEPPPTSLTPPFEPSKSSPATGVAVAAGAPSSHVPDQEEAEAETPRPATQPPVQQQQKNPSPDFSRPETPITAKRTKQDLPIFTSTSPISFGKSNVFNLAVGQTLHSNGYAVSHPKPSILQPSSERPTVTGAVAQEVKVPSNSPLSSTPTDLKQEPLSYTSIWDVPETPHPRKP
jgi:histone deacetylase HOS3